VTTQGGQRFRRRALRRGYKADEVDDFLARAEATVNGEPVDEVVTAKQVHDVVFRVRFGGYDEWQVDVYLDRLERQLTTLEEQSGIPAPARSGPSRRREESGFGQGDRGLSPDWGLGPDPGEAPADYGPGRRARFDREFPEPEHPRPDRGMRPEMEDPRYPRHDESPMSRRPPDRPMPPAAAPPRPVQGAVPMPPPPRQMPPPPAAAPPPMPPRPPAPGRTPPPSHGMPPMRAEPDHAMTQHIPPIPGGYEPGRHGKLDMTSEIRAVDSPFKPEDTHRLEQLRRTFQIRRFGSGYDRTQVDRLFDAIGATMVGRSAVRVTDGELDPGQFSLVPGGYFEAEVDTALREVRELFTRRGVTR